MCSSHNYGSALYVIDCLLALYNNRVILSLYITFKLYANTSQPPSLRSGWSEKWWVVEEVIIYNHTLSVKSSIENNAHFKRYSSIHAFGFIIMYKQSFTQLRLVKL